MSKNSKELGEEPIANLLWKQSLPASIGILVMSLYTIIDTIFVGQYIGALAIGALTIVLPITFLVSVIGMSIGIGGSSIISRSLGAGDKEKADLSFGNMVLLCLSLSTFMILLFAFYNTEIIQFFGGKKELLEPSLLYFNILVFGVPFQAWAMMSNNVIRSEGNAKMAMLTMLIPALINIILDALFIAYFGWGIEGAALASVIAYICSAIYTLYYFASKRTELKFQLRNLILRIPIVKEIFSIGGVTLARQGIISVLAVVLNNSLVRYGGEFSVAIYGILNRIMFIANFPVLGITQGFLPIAGYNFGASKLDRVKKVIEVSIKYGTILAFGLFLLVLLLAPQLTRLFTDNTQLLIDAPFAIRVAFLATPFLTIQLIGSAYYQAIGKALPALFLSITKQGIFLIPLVLILPRFFGLNGIWYSFPIADIMTAGVSFWFIQRAKSKLDKALSVSSEV